MTCEACLTDFVVDPSDQNSFIYKLSENETITLCDKCKRKVEAGLVSKSSLILIHNYFRLGYRKKFLK